MYNKDGILRFNYNITMRLHKVQIFLLMFLLHSCNFYIFKNNWYDICNLLFQNSSTYDPKTIIIEYRKI